MEGTAWVGYGDILFVVGLWWGGTKFEDFVVVECQREEYAI
jgi:hypothetical protein